MSPQSQGANDQPRSPAGEPFSSPERFRLIRRIGAGGMGVVWEALDLERNARVALKTFHESKPLSLLHLKEEFRGLVEIRHPNLIAFY
jgi:serine/threonine protein kinase